MIVMTSSIVKMEIVMNTHIETAESALIDLGNASVETQGAQNQGVDNGIQLKGQFEGLTED